MLAQQVYTIRPAAESTLTLEVFKTGVLTGKKHLFFFEEYTGEIAYDPEHVENCSVRFEVAARSIACRDTWVSAEDRKKILEAALNDMLAASEHPQLSIVSSRIVTKSKGQYEVEGDLTIRGIARPVTIQAAVKEVGGTRLEIDGDARISHKDYGLKPLSRFGGIVGTKDEMLVRFLVWAEKSA